MDCVSAVQPDAVLEGLAVSLKLLLPSTATDLAAGSGIINGSKDPGSPRTEAMPAHRRTAACADQAALKTSVRSSMLSRGTSAGAVGSSDIWPFVRMRASVSKQVRNCAADLFAKVRFAVDSPLEEAGFELSVPPAGAGLFRR
jgi:hypothetical protein